MTLMTLANVILARMAHGAFACLLLAAPVFADDDSKPKPKPEAPAPAENKEAKGEGTGGGAGADTEADKADTEVDKAESEAGKADATTEKPKVTASVRLTNMRYMHYLVNSPNATFGDACRVVHQLIGKSKYVSSIPKAKGELEKAGIIPESWAAKDSEQLLENGVLAYMLCKVLQIDGGLTMRTVCRVLGLTERYAYRECVDIKLLSSAGQSQLVSGEEIVDAFRRARNYQKDGKVE